MKTPNAIFAVLLGATAVAAEVSPQAAWSVGTPIVTYWCGPAMTDAAARQMVEGGWNLVWCTEAELDVARRHGLRAQLTHGLLSPASLDDPTKRAELDALVERVRRHPALYAYHLTDEPSAAAFPALGRLVAYLRERDPAHLAYINLFPTYANNEQLGTQGDVVTAYREHLAQYVATVKPALISYDHYQFALKGDNEQYFLNLAMIRRAALDAGLPFLNIVQSCTWAPQVMRVPQPDEMRYLVYTTLAYGAQGISYYVYNCPNHVGAITAPDGTPGPLYEALKRLNPEFVAIAGALQPLQSLGVFHAGMTPLPKGGEPLPGKAVFWFDPLPAPIEFKPPVPVKGVLLGTFGPAGTRGRPAAATHAVIVNLDYQAEQTFSLRAAKRLEMFEPAAGGWSGSQGKRVELRLPPGGGRLVRLRGS